MQSFFIGIGAVVGSLLPYMFTNWIGLDNTAPEGVIPESVKWSFYVGGAVFFLAVLWTVLKSKEYPPEQLEAFEAAEKGNTGMVEKDHFDPANIRVQQRTGIIMLLLGAVVTFYIYRADLAKELYILFVGLVVAGILFVLAAFYRKQQRTNGFTTIMTDMINMPDTMKKLAWVQFFSWFALFSMWIYTTQAVTGHVFNTSDPTSKAYNDAADWVPVMFTVYNGVAAAVAFLLPVLARRIGDKQTHFLALILGGLGLMAIFIVETKIGLLLTMLGVGVAWASILSIPYALLSGSLPSAKMGYYMGVFNFFIVIPQIVAATILGFLVKELFANQPVYALVVGGAGMILAAFLTLRVNVNQPAEINA
jgi:maltose/moltooligosaccharide transporter